MIKTINLLLQEYKEYSDPRGKVQRDVKNNLLFPIIRGVYETNKETSGLLLASIIYGPSYISFEYALSHHGLIPERVFLYTSATYNKRRSKFYETTFGNFSYRDIPKDVYSYGIETIITNGYVVFMAKPEKALCDKLYEVSPVSNLTELDELLFENLRIDEKMFNELDKDFLLKIIPKYRSTTLNLLKKKLSKEKGEL